MKDSDGFFCQSCLTNNGKGDAVNDFQRFFLIQFLASILALILIFLVSRVVKRIMKLTDEPELPEN